MDKIKVVNRYKSKGFLLWIIVTCIFEVILLCGLILGANKNVHLSTYFITGVWSLVTAVGIRCRYLAFNNPIKLFEGDKK